MKKLFSLIIIFCFFLFFSTIIIAQDKKDAAAEKPRVAVMDLDAKGLTQEEAEAVADFLRTDLLNTEKFTVIERSRVKDILKEQQFSMSGVTDTEKATKIGKLLNCKLIVVGTLSKLGAKYFLNVRAVDVETGETKLGKRESTSTLEELSEVSRVIAQQLAGMKVTYREKGTGATPYTGDQVEYNSPPVGFDVQFGFSPNYKWYYSSTIDNSYLDGSSINQTYITKADMKYFNFILGGYFSFLYLGIKSKNVSMDRGTQLEREQSQTSSFFNPYDYSGLKDTPLLNADYIGTVADLMLGFRLYQPGNNLNFSVFYFSWHSIKLDDSINPAIVYAGPCLGIYGKIGGGKGCCTLGARSDGPINLFMDYGIYGAFIQADKSSIPTSEKASGFSFGGELGFGIMLRKIGLYALINYNLDALAISESGNYYDPYILEIVNYKQAQVLIFHGAEIRIGYTFDMQVLFH